MSGAILPPHPWTPRAELDAGRRLWVAVTLSPRVETCEALLWGVPVPARRLDPAWRETLGLSDDVVLDEPLVARINANGPLFQEREA